MFNDNFHYLQAERIGPRTTFPTSDYIVRTHRQIGTSGEYTTHLLKLFGSEERSMEKGELLVLLRPRVITSEDEAQLAGDEQLRKHPQASNAGAIRSDALEFDL